MSAKDVPLHFGQLSQIPDSDPAETQEWVDSVNAMVDAVGPERARFILEVAAQHARTHGVQLSPAVTTPHINTIPSSEDLPYPGDLEKEARFAGMVRWNEAVMVTRGQREGIEVGGHISSYAGQSTLWEVGLQHVFKGLDAPGGGDQIFFQGHSAEGIYTRAFLEGRLSEADLDSYRQEASRLSGGRGLSSYAHPHSMPDFWQFPTVSLGLGITNAIYQAWFNRYLEGRGIKDTSQQHVWALVGDGEMDEVESRGLAHFAAYQKLDNLTMIVNCNLQRLDGPVRGDSSIIEELEGSFRGAGWNVIKLIWSSDWDQLLAKDTDQALIDLMGRTPDGEYQAFPAKDGGFIRDNFFASDPRTKAMVEDLTDEQLFTMRRGGHDPIKIYTAMQAALAHKGQPTVILAQTVKGYGLGTDFEGRNATHQKDSLTTQNFKDLRDRVGLPIPDEALADPLNVPYFKPEDDDPVLVYAREQRRKLGGFIPQRRAHQGGVTLPADKPFKALTKGSGKQKVATTMALVRLMKDIVKDKDFGFRIVPIVPDEARTFGMEAMFPKDKIFNTLGQVYTPVDADMLLSYRESTKGVIMHTGITEAGSMGAFMAAGTSYSTHNIPMVPFYIFYSMFGFQRTGDQFWAAQDAKARGFIIGATAGRTTLTGEGAQHMDGHSPVLASTNPAVVIYDPAYAYEIGHIFRDGLVRMYGDGSDGRNQDVMYYLTVYNEPIHQPAEPENLDVEGLLKGIYQLEGHDNLGGPKVQLMASGVAVPWIHRAKEMLRNDWGVDAALWSVTSWYELRRDGLAVNEHNYLHPEEAPQTAYLTQKLAGAEGPFVATSDFEHQVQDSIREWVPGKYVTLGANGIGISDTRVAARRYYKVDAASVVVRTLAALADEGKVDRSVVSQAIQKYDLFSPATALKQSLDNLD